MSTFKPPSDAELLLLQALWEHPGATVQTVHEWLARQEKRVAYTTVLTQLQRMHTKGLVSRERIGRQHHYRARQDREVMEARLVEHLRNTAFGGSPVRLALRALGNERSPDPAELDELQRWLDEQKSGEHD